jgi:peptidoglycan/LPS O-acetylase OafA/YrhL
VTEFYVAGSWTGRGFARQWLGHIADGEWLSGTGSMWFCAALLAFSIVYALVRAAADRFDGSDRRLAVPSLAIVAVFIAAMAGATFLTRTQIPAGASVLNMHPGDFPQYILMFLAGLLAARGRWLEEISDRTVIIVALTTLAISVALWIALLAWVALSPGDHHEFDGGWNPVSAGKSLWEALVCIGMSFALIAIYRRDFNLQGRLARLLSDNAFAVYLVHPPILIAIALLLRTVDVPAPLKAATLTSLAAIACFMLSALLLRRLPLLRRIL